MSEHGELPCRLVDLDPASDPDASALFEEVWHRGGSDENRVAIRDGRRLVARLVQAKQADRMDFRFVRTAQYLSGRGDSLKSIRSACLACTRRATSRRPPIATRFSSDPPRARPPRTAPMRPDHCRVKVDKAAAQLAVLADQHFAQPQTGPNQARLSRTSAAPRVTRKSAGGFSNRAPISACARYRADRQPGLASRRPWMSRHSTERVQAPQVDDPSSGAPHAIACRSTCGNRPGARAGTPACFGAMRPKQPAQLIADTALVGQHQPASPPVPLPWPVPSSPPATAGHLA